jgi:hypothetical protein
MPWTTVSHNKMAQTTMEAARRLNITPVACASSRSERRRDHGASDGLFFFFFFGFSPLSKEALMGVITLGLLWSWKLGDSAR